MTTVVVSKKEMAMAADRQGTWGDAKFVIEPKISKLYNKKYKTHALLASSGDIGICHIFEEWFKESFFLGKLKSFPVKLTRKAEDKFFGLVLTSSCQIIMYANSWQPIEVNEPYFAVGTGGEFAIGAMDHGATIREAIRIASLRVINTGLGIQVESIPRDSTGSPPRGFTLSDEKSK